MDIPLFIKLGITAVRKRNEKSVDHVRINGLIEGQILPLASVAHCLLGPTVIERA